MALKRRNLHNEASATGTGNDITVRGRAGVLLQVTGTFTATLTVQATLDGKNWHAIQAIDLSDNSRSTTISSSGLYFVPAPGLSATRANITSYSSGSVTVVAGATSAPGTPT